MGHVSPRLLFCVSRPGDHRCGGLGCRLRDLGEDQDVGGVGEARPAVAEQGAEMNLVSRPAALQRLAAPCRRSWNLTGGSPAR